MSLIEDANKYLEKALVHWDEKNRRKSFKKWVFSDKVACNANKLAEAGFLFIGTKEEPDGVICFFCSKPLDGWDATDDPWLEHLKHAPNCSFAKLQKPQDSITLKDYLDLREEYKKIMLRSYVDQVKNNLEEKLDKIESMMKKVK